jgi:hypothetical protein
VDHITGHDHHSRFGVDPCEIGQMPLHYILALETGASRRLRRCAPLLMLLGIFAGALVHRPELPIFI